MIEQGITGGTLAFDHVVIDLTGRRVLVDGQTVALEPKAFAVLCLLARNPGQAFTREQILDAVWGHRHVTAGALNRVMTLVRQAIGDDRREVVYLRTLYGVGYRFDAPVRQVPEPVDRHVSPVAAADGAALQTPTGWVSGADVDATNTGRRDEPPARIPARPSVEPSPDEVPHRSARLGRQRAGRMALAAFLVLGVAAAWLMFDQPRGAMERSALAVPTLVVLPLHAVGEDKDEANFAAGLSEELITRLAHIDGLRLISATSAARAAHQGLDLQQLVESLHVTHALEGSLRQHDGLLRIDLRLVEMPSGRTLWTQDFDRSLADVFAVQRDIAQAVAASLAPRFGMIEARDAGVDAQVFRDYVRARAQFRSENLSVFRREAIGTFRALAARAPGYAQLHGTLALALATNLTLGTASAAELDEARREATLALDADPALAEAHTAIALLACRRADWEVCMDAFRRAVSLDATDSQTHALYAYWMVALGYRAEALQEAEAAWQVDPLGFQTNFVRSRILDTLGRHDEARAFLDAQASQPDASTPVLLYARWFNAVWRKDFAHAQQFAAALSPEDGFREAYLRTADALVDPSMWPAAEVAIAQSEATTGKFNFLRLLLPTPDTRSALAGVTSALRTGFPSYYMLLWQPEYAALRADPLFQDFLRSAGLLAHWKANGWPSQCTATDSGAQCD